MNKPILFSRSSVAMMIRVALHFNPGFGSGYSRTQLRLMACGRMQPRPSILASLNLTPTEDGYQWHA